MANRITCIASRNPPLRIKLFSAVSFSLMVALLGGTTLVNGSSQDLDKLNRFVQSQRSSEAPMNLFREGRDCIGDENWRRAAEKFRGFIEVYPKDKNVDAALYWLAFALKKQDRFREANDNLKRLLREFARSKWRDDANAMRVEIAPHLGDTDAVLEILTGPGGPIGPGSKFIFHSPFGVAPKPSVVVRPSGSPIPPPSPRSSRSSRAENSDEEIKIIALQSLFQANPERAIAYVSNLLKPGSQASRRFKESAIEMLRRESSKDAVALLAGVVRNDPDAKLRVAALHTLGRIDDASVIPLLREIATGSGDDEIRKAAIFAISRRDSAGARGLLVQLAQTARSRDVRKEAVFWLGKDGSDEVIDELMKIYAADAGAEIGRQVGAGIGKQVSREIGRQLGTEIRSQIDTEIRKQIIFALKRMNTPRSAAKLYDIARSRDDIEVRKDAIQWIGERSDEQAVEILSRLYDTESSEAARDQIISALSRTKQRSALRKLMQIARSDASVELRKKAVFQLGRSDDPEAAKFLEDILK